MSGLLDGKTAIVDGGSGAIGGAAARLFAREGAHVFLTGRTATLLGRLPRLAEVAEYAAFAAADRAGAMTGAIANLTCGLLTD